MPAGARAVAGAPAAQSDAVLRVVVDRLDIERGRELLLRRGKAPGAVVRPRQGLAYGALGGLERPGLLQRDHGRVRIVVREQTRALAESGVCVVLA